MRYTFLSLFLLVFFGCSGVKDVTKMTPDERFQYALSLYQEESYDLAIKEFDAFLLQYPGSEFSDDAQFYIGQSRAKRKEYLLAAFEFGRLIKNMPASSFIPEAQYMLATCYFELSSPFPLDQKYTRKAIEELQAFIDFFPADERVPEAEKKIIILYEKLAEKEFNDAYIYERLEYYTAALSYYAKVMETYHDTKFAPTAQYHRIKILERKNRLTELSTECGLFLEKYPSHEKVNEVTQILSSAKSKVAIAK